MPGKSSKRARQREKRKKIDARQKAIDEERNRRIADAKAKQNQGKDVSTDTVSSLNSSASASAHKSEYVPAASSARKKDAAKKPNKDASVVTFDFYAKSRHAPPSAAVAELEKIVSSIHSATAKGESLAACLSNALKLLPSFASERAKLEDLHINQVREEEDICASAQSEVLSLSSYAGKKASGAGVLERGDHKRVLKEAEGRLDKIKEGKRRSDARRDSELSRLNKGEADATMWIAQLYSDPASAKDGETNEKTFEQVREKRRRLSLTYFKVAIGRFRALYKVSKDSERDAWLAQLPSDAMKIVTSCRLSPQVASAMNGVVGEAGASVARGRVLMRYYLQSLQTSKTNIVSTGSTESDVQDIATTRTPRNAAQEKLVSEVLSDFNVGVRIYSHIGHKGEVLSTLENMAQFHAMCGEFDKAADVERKRTLVYRDMQDFAGMIRASQDEAVMFMRAAQQAAPSHASRQTKQWRAHIQKAAEASRRAVGICQTVSQQDMAEVFLTRPRDVADGGLMSRSLHTLSRAYAAVWDVQTLTDGVSRGEDVDNGAGLHNGTVSVLGSIEANEVGGERIPFENPSECAMIAREWLSKAVSAASAAREAWKSRLSSPPGATDTRNQSAVHKALIKRLRHMNLELGNLEFGIVMKDQRGWEATAALASQSSDDVFSDRAKLKYQQEILKSAALHLSTALQIHSEERAFDKDDDASQSVTEHHLKFEGQVKQQLASVATMQGNLSLARAYYKEASEALELTGDQAGADSCRDFMNRLPSGGEDTVGSSTNYSQNSDSSGVKSLGGFVQDVDGIDSDDELGEEGVLD